jgi:membrane-associated PAP2 superfamily phosphatase
MTGPRPFTWPRRFTWQRDAATTAIALALLLAWDASGLDLAVARLFANAQGFALREAWWASQLLHDGGRIASWLLLAAVALGGLQRPGAGEPPRRWRWTWVGLILLCAVAVPALKRVSTTSCPWDLAEFGGKALYVSHWRFGLADGGGGRCFPSGHAVAAFAFFGLHFFWRDFNARKAGLWLAAVLLLGTVYGAAQLVRGAHYPSHTLWSAWLCWAVCALAYHALKSKETAP